MKLIHNWKDAWKFFSTQLIVLLAVIPTVWEALPADFKASIPPDTLSWVAGVLGVLGVISRMISQYPAVTTPADPTDSQ
jgi:hypothetical protein